MAKEEVRRDSPVLEEPRRLPPLLRGRRAGADGEEGGEHDGSTAPCSVAGACSAAPCSFTAEEGGARPVLLSSTGGPPRAGQGAAGAGQVL
jgi:hypothetical protein